MPEIIKELNSKEICADCKRNKNVGFISTRLAGTDGVSLEAEK